METRIVKLLKILIKIAIMLLVMTGIILINRSYMKNADGSETDGRRVLIERVSKEGLITYSQGETRHINSSIPDNLL